MKTVEDARRINQQLQSVQPHMSPAVQQPGANVRDTLRTIEEINRLNRLNQQMRDIEKKTRTP